MKIAPHTFEFIERWRQKGLEYPLDDHRSNYFDRFVTGLILYNCLYNELNEILCLKFKLNEDKKKAVTVVKEFLTVKSIHDETVVSENGNEIRRLIKAKEFYIWDKNTDHRHEAVDQLGSSQSGEWVTGLLTIFYGVRCNMFHGDKDYSGNQVKILTPCIHVIEKLNDMTIKKLQTNAEST